MLLAITIDWSKWLTPENIGVAVRIILLVCIGFPLLYLLSALAGRATKKRFSQQTSMLTRKGVFYAGFTLLVVTVLAQMGFTLTALFGAAGVAGIAIGFASQTSVSNIISGLFLISEQPFAVGDVIKVSDLTGTVLSIDLLSLKLRTFDNQYVRLPNEMLIKSTVTNITRFPIRRLDINIGVAYRSDVSHVRRVLMDIARNNPYCLDEPEPLVLFKNFGDSAMEFLFAVWFVREDLLKIRNTIMQEIKERFDAEGIEIPFPHRALYTGEITNPFPVRIVEQVKSGAEK